MGMIPRDLPFIKREAAAAIGAAYPTQQVANDTIAQKLRDFYRNNYNKIYMSRRPDVERAVAGAQQFYVRNVFPEMNVGWGTYSNNIGHMDFPGCFRCHDENHKTQGRQDDRAGLQPLPRHSVKSSQVPRSKGPRTEAVRGSDGLAAGRLGVGSPVERGRVAWLAGVVIACSAGVAAQQPASAAAGRRVYEREKCAACHQIAKQGNSRYPLDGVASRLTADQIAPLDHRHRPRWKRRCPACRPSACRPRNTASNPPTSTPWSCTCRR